jgi:hypothetical protein
MKANKTHSLRLKPYHGNLQLWLRVLNIQRGIFMRRRVSVYVLGALPVYR